MDSYRPLHERDNDSDDGFQIRGAASRQYREQDVPSRRERDDRYYSSNDNHRRSRYGYNSSEAYRDTSNNGYSDEHDLYNEPEHPPPNTGDGDVATTDTSFPFLLIRGLKSNVDEEKLRKGLEKLNIDESEVSASENSTMTQIALPPPPGPPSQPPCGAEPFSLKRVLLIRDRITDKTMQYGFAEYHDVKNARAALNKAKKLGEKCTIASKKITIDFPHGGVFYPPLMTGKKDRDIHFHFDINGTAYTYHDLRYYASPLIVNSEPPARPKSPSPPKSISTKSGKKRGNELDDVETVDKQGSAKPKKTKTGPSFDMWQKKQGELRGETGEPQDDIVDGGPDDSGTEQDQDFGTSFIVPGEKMKKDASMRICLLCGTAFKESVQPEDHAHKSEPHLLNLKQKEKIKQASVRLGKNGLTESDYIQLRWGKDAREHRDDQKAQYQYRDRAKERRQDEVNSGMTKKINVSLKPASKDRNTKPSVGSASLSSEPNEPSYGMGLKMLQKAGWSEGQGLGSGGGIAAPIEQNMYAAGVGLGHEGSKKGDAVEEASRMTKGEPGSFLEKTREGARERFNRME